MKRLLLFIFCVGYNLVNLFAQTCPDIIGYYPNWQWYDRSQLVNPMTIQYHKYTIINYAFFKPETNGSISSTDAWADQNLLLGQINWSTTPVSYYPNTSIVDRAHNANTKVLPSIGGWTLSDNFPGIASNATKRTLFAHSCCDLIRTYNFDGIDIDWEYPGYTPNSGTPADKQNFTLLLQQIRDSLTALGLQNNKTYMLTACFGASKNNMLNIEWNSVKNIVDIINLMSYDYFGSWDATANHNSPLHKPLQGDPTFNIDSSVNYLLTHYQIPANKLAAGVAFYGRSAKTTGAPALFAPITGVDNITFGEDDGTPLYYNVVKKQNLFTRVWDAQAKVPYLVGNGNLQTFVSYDDEESIGLKAQYIKNKNLRGAIIWEITGDYLETTPGSGIIGSTPLIDTLKSVFCNGIGSPNNVTVSPSGNVTLCNGASQMLMANAGFSSYLWNTGATTQSITVTTPGNYFVTAITTSNDTLISNSVSVTFTNCTTNIPPVVNITSPANNSSVLVGSATTVQMNATDADGNITLVELFQNNVLIASFTSPPYQYQLNNNTAGVFNLQAKAYDNVNAQTSSAAIQYTVVSNNSNLICNYPLWNSTTVYNTNDTVAYNNIIYKAKYWSQGNNPSSSYGSAGVWDLIMPCGGYTSATCFKPVYDSLVAYTTNEEVFYNGNVYRAKWWTLNLNPASNSGSGDVWLLLTTPCYAQIEVKVFIEGYYNGMSNLKPVLYNQAMSTNNLVCDSLTLELRQSTFPYAKVYSCHDILNTNGIFTGILPSSYLGQNFYLILKHRNSVSTWSSQPVTIQAMGSYNFSNAQNKAYGNNQVEVEPGIWAMYSGDIDQDGVVDALDYLIMDPDIINGASGYMNTDLNGDGSVDALDYLVLDPNIVNGVGANKP